MVEAERKTQNKLTEGLEVRKHFFGKLEYVLPPFDAWQFLAFKRMRNEHSGLLTSD